MAAAGTGSAAAQEGGLKLRGCASGEEMNTKLMHMPGSQAFSPEVLDVRFFAWGTPSFQRVGEIHTFLAIGDNSECWGLGYCWTYGVVLLPLTCFFRCSSWTCVILAEVILTQQS